MEIDGQGQGLLHEPHETDASLSVLSDEEAVELLRTASRIAIVGASAHPWRASHTVMRYLLDAGYDCVPVTPKTDEVLGRPCHDSLEEAVAATGPFDIVDVFRRPEFAPGVARSTVTTGCGALWLQQGIVSAEAARIAHAGGISVVMDRCTAVLHRHLRDKAR